MEWDIHLDRLRGLLKRNQFLVVSFALLTVNLIVSFLLKSQCIYGPWNGHQYTSLCYNDIQPYYFLRHFHENKIPYITEKVMEYPALTGLWNWLASLVTNDYNVFYMIQIPFLALLAYVLFWILYKIVGEKKSLWIYCLAPTLNLYAFLNWDLLALVPLFIAIYFWQNEKKNQSLFWIGVGTSAKLFPGFLVPFFLMESKKNWFRLGLISLAGFLLFTLPFLLWEWFSQRTIVGTFSFLSFHGERAAGTGSLLYWVTRWFAKWIPFQSSAFLNALSGFLFLTAALLIFSHIHRKKLDAISGSLLFLILFVAINKVASPQYMLWILPFLSLYKIPLNRVFLFFLADVFCFICSFLSFTKYHHPLWDMGLMASVVLRTVVLMLLFWEFSNNEFPRLQRSASREV